MKLIHTSDWHLGRTLYGQKRYGEFAAFLDWLAEIIDQAGAEVLLVAGDVFDNSTPSNRAQELYYRFLCRVAASSCRHVVIVAGNHDSPSFLNAPRELLRALNVHVVGCAAANPADEVLLLTAADGAPQLIVAAVPYLRDRDLRQAEAGESLEDKERKLLDGIRTRYRAAGAAAAELRARLGQNVPIVATGHLFTAGGRTVDGDGVRELYVGSLAHVGGDTFPENIDYLALGHLHVAQQVGGSATRRYSGSPLPMGFGEAAQQKCVLQVDLAAGAQVVAVPVPCFQRLERIRGDRAAIFRRLEALRAADCDAWLEVFYQGEELAGDLRASLDAAVAGSRLTVLRTRNERVAEQALHGADQDETLDDLDCDDVFQRCLEAHQVPAHQRGELLATYREALTGLLEADPRAE